jgi:glutamine synthetase
VRVVGAGPSLRIEHRVPGGDANPYLAVAAIIAAGLHGIEHELPLPPEQAGNTAPPNAQRLPETLGTAVELFAGSDIAAKAFGDAVVGHYAHAAREELHAFHSTVTDWERARGFERR